MCDITKITENEDNSRKFENKIKLINIIEVESSNINKVYAQLCNARIEGKVFIDTCNAFRKANPQIPDNEMFHTFVINRQGKVLMVGNPFQNDKMETLFKKVIANECKKQKTRETA